MDIDVYVFTGNAYGDGYDGVNNFNESALKLDPANSLNLVDWFTAGNWSYLDNHDLDLSSSGPLLIPGHEPHRRRRQDGLPLRARYDKPW